MTEEFKPGLYEDLITDGLRIELQRLSADLAISEKDIDVAEIPSRLSRHLSRVLLRALEAMAEEDRQKIGPEFVRQIIRQANSLSGMEEIETDYISGNPAVLEEVSTRLPDGSVKSSKRPLTSLIDTTFLTNARGEPALQHEIESEIGSSSSVDILMAFVRWTGVRPLIEQFKEHIAMGGRVRLITTVYTNSTEQRALEELVAIGVEVKISYDVTQTRLHAKAWLFSRPRGFSTAYIGSSNMTASAQVAGVEWNMRIAEATNPDVIQKFNAVFETYWQNSDFKDFESKEFANYTENQKRPEPNLSLFLIQPWPFQQRLLDELRASREAGFNRNLLVAATGTGKTVMAAFDFLEIISRQPSARLLFVAHRKEILSQSQRVFAEILRNPGFGELWVGGDKPSKFDHVFASIQTLDNQDIESIDPEYYDVIIIDEFHHASAPTYRRILEHFKPRQLVGLTATPERGDGVSILDYFDGRIAAELRIWDAIEQQHLCPFVYFGIRDEIDLSAVAWRRGFGYDLSEITKIYTSSHRWISLVIQQVKDKVLDPTAMKALGFCAGVEHAKFVAMQFNNAGIKSVSLTGNNASVEREDAIKRLRKGEIQAIFTVDIFNEGIDIPEADTLLLLRPTDSGLLFMQQLGRGLRRSKNKTVCTVLDFVGHHRKEFRYENRFRSLVGGTRKELIESVEGGFPFLPSGCQINLDRHAQKEILDSFRNSIPSKWSNIVAELRSIGDVSLADFLEVTGLSIEDIYSSSRSFAELRRAAGLDDSIAEVEESTLLRGVGRLCHINDSLRIRKYSDWLADDKRPDYLSLSVQDQRLLRMLSASVCSAQKSNDADAEVDRIWKYSSVLRELRELLVVVAQKLDFVHPEFGDVKNIPLRIHGLYSRIEIQAALNDVKEGKIREWREGVRYLDEIATDVFLFTVDKSLGGFSPTTRYRDYAISSKLIHWESQSTTGFRSKTGQRYINQRTNGTTVLLFGRQSKASDAWWFLGPADYISHSGERPIAFTWELRNDLPAALLILFATAVA